MGASRRHGSPTPTVRTALRAALATRLRRKNWFHYSGDYRIGTCYLDEPILDHIKQQAMQVPFLRDLLRSDSIYIRSNITFHNLAPLSTYLGKPGNPAKGGISFAEYKRRQAQHREAAHYGTPIVLTRSSSRP